MDKIILNNAEIKIAIESGIINRIETREFAPKITFKIALILDILKSRYKILSSEAEKILLSKIKVDENGNKIQNSTKDFFELKEGASKQDLIKDIDEFYAIKNILGVRQKISIDIFDRVQGITISEITFLKKIFNIEEE